MADIAVYFDQSGLGGEVGDPDLWPDVVNWEGSLPGGQFLALHSLVERGWSENLEALEDELGDALEEEPPPAAVANVLLELLGTIQARDEGDGAVALALNSDDNASVENKFNPAQKRDAKGRFARVAEATRKVEKAKGRVAKAQQALEKAKAALKVEKSGLVTAKRTLATVKSEEKAKSASARGAIKKAAAREPVDVQKHVTYGKALLAEGMAYKTVKKPGEPPVAVATMPDKAYHQKVDDHMGALTKTLNKAQSIELLKGYGLPALASTTKKRALENVKKYLIGNRGSFFRGKE